jgi:hypothetical protein
LHGQLDGNAGFDRRKHRHDSPLESESQLWIRPLTRTRLEIDGRVI